MLGYVFLLGFELCGCVVASRLARREGRLTRAWLGLSLGLVMMMWLPSLYAFALKFTLAAQLFALGTAALMAGSSLALGARAPAERPEETRTKNEPPVKLLLLLVLPLVCVFAYLQFTHTLREADGALRVGQSTYGDLCLHLGIATGLRGASYPPEYTILPGALLGYPFLTDALSATMLLGDTSLQGAFAVPGTLMGALVMWGFVMLAWHMTKSARATALSFFLLFLNGGLGFFYVFDTVFRDPSALRDALFGYYYAPANLLEHNVRWANVIVDLLIPQRTLLAGWTALIPALWLMYKAVETKRPRDFLLLGLWAGAMPMIHTHSFFALGLISAGGMAYLLIRAKRARGAYLRGFLLYGGVAVALAAPQLLTWTFPQTLGGGSLSFRFNWANWQNGGLVDEYFFFWIKNVGPVYLLLAPAAAYAGRRQRFVAFGALTVYVVAELIQFQPNEYDNNKLFYAAFLAVLPMVGGYLVSAYDRLRGLPGRRFLAGVFVLVCVLSGAMSVAREWISDYELFSKDMADAGEYADEHAFEDAVFLTGGQHNNPVAVLAGRRIVCGTSLYLNWHGVDDTERREATRVMYETPAQSGSLYEEYAVDYVYVSAYERGEFDVNEAALQTLYPVWYENEEITVYAVSERAQMQLEEAA